nr:cell division cycle protein 27 homolog B isoform X1 [Ipomoea batatas]
MGPTAFHYKTEKEKLKGNTPLEEPPIRRNTPLVSTCLKIEYLAPLLPPPPLAFYCSHVLESHESSSGILVISLNRASSLFSNGSHTRRLCAKQFAAFHVPQRHFHTNMQLLAACYLQNNQAYAAYHILKGTQMAQSRYLFALSCFQMDLLNEAEMALSQTNDPTSEVPNGAAGHYLLGLIYRYTDRKKSAVHHFNQALSLDPLLWAAYEELCILGAADEAASVFNEAASLCVQKKHEHHGKDASPRQLRHMHSNSLREFSGNYNGVIASGGVTSQSLSSGPANNAFCNTPSPMASQHFNAFQISGLAPPPVCRNAQQNGVHPSAPGGDNSLRSAVNSNVQPPRRKFVDEGKLRKVVTYFDDFLSACTLVSLSSNGNFVCEKSNRN